MTGIPEELSFPSHDGVELFYRRWKTAGPSKGAIVLFHRGHEHGARMAHLVDELNLPDYDFYAWDARGLGRSPGERGYAPSFQWLVRDVQSFIDHISQKYGTATEDIAVVAQSVGAVIVSAWAHDYAPNIRAMVLASPAFSVKLYVPLARQGLGLMQKFRGKFFVNSYVKAKFLTHDQGRQKSYDADPLITRPIAVNILLGLYETAERVAKDARAITIPTQLLVSGADFVVHHGPQHEFFVNLGSDVKERHILKGFFHDTLGEEKREGAVAEVRRFLLERFAEPFKRPNLRRAHHIGYTRDEADMLATPLPLFSAKGLYWRAYRINLALGSLLSEGIALGQQTGFDSGSTLDYVYRNEAKGIGPLGRVSDRKYLDAIGWKGIRRRKENLEELIRLALSKLGEAGQPRRVIDIAAGHGRYVLEALTEGTLQPESILLRDYSDINVAAGKALIASKNLDAIARFEKADAFDRDSIAEVSPQPTLGIVSGLYELFPDNEMIERSLSGLAAAIPKNGYLIYTNQPWHPQLEMIARALTSHRAGAAWVMRRRTQGEMDQLVAAAGFRKLTMRVDDWGIFTVSLAIREG
ncbi:MAG: bifunctional alpha/beta hydrolase/class I SAM-dependent methyltransferase [Micavibrio sp.]|nr:bifunctional alpha/beta hydrolase/class I SAM-dependent methyltransferase [Micavibrio sp.]